MNGITDIITGAVADGIEHQFEWWFAGFVVGMTVGSVGLLVRFIRMARNGQTITEI